MICYFSQTAFVILDGTGSLMRLHSPRGSAGARPAGPARHLSPWFLSSSKRLNQASSHGGSSIPMRISLIEQALVKSWAVLHLFTSHWPKQVTGPESICGREVSVQNCGCWKTWFIDRVAR